MVSWPAAGELQHLLGKGASESADTLQLFADSSQLWQSHTPDLCGGRGTNQDVDVMNDDNKIEWISQFNIFF